MPVIRQHEFYVSAGQTICRHCGVDRARRNEEQCDPRPVPSPTLSPAAPSSTVPPVAPQPAPPLDGAPSPAPPPEVLGPLRIVQVPAAEGKASGRHHFVGVVDASGSMKPYWADVVKHYNACVPRDGTATTITFDAQPRLSPTVTLSADLNAHGGGMTSILRAFEQMDEVLGRLPDGPVTVLFISDGQDNVTDNLQLRLPGLRGGGGRSLTFLCLGIEKNFPTFISMQLREMYHTAQSTIPVLFLVEYASEKAFFNKFESLKPFLNPVQRRRVQPAVRVMPWAPPTADVYGNTWVATRERWLTVDGVALEVPTDSVTFHSVQELLRGVVQELEMLALTKDPDLQGKASAASQFMNEVLDGLHKATGLDVRGEAAEVGDAQRWGGFRQRVLRLEALHRRFWLAAYLQTVDQLAQGQAATSLSEWDAAKRLNLGTFLGKHNQRNLAAKGVGPERFAAMKAAFAAALQQVHRTAPPLPQPPAELQWQSDVLRDPELGPALPLVGSQFDLVQCLPLVGRAVRLKRYDGSLQDPWLVQVQAIRPGSEPVHSLALIKVQGTDRSYRCVLDGEEYNAVLPALREGDRPLLPALTSELFHFLMTFNVMLNPDAVEPDAPLALLCHSMAHLLELPASPSQRDLLDEMVQAAELLCEAYPDFKALIARLTDKNFDVAQLAMSTYPDQLKTMLALLVAARRSPPCPLGVLVRALDLLCRAYVLQSKGAGGGLHAVLQLEFDPQAVTQEVVRRATPLFPTFYTLGDLQRCVKDLAVDCVQDQRHPLRFRELRSGAEGLELSQRQVAQLYALLHPNGEAPSQEDWLRIATATVGEGDGAGPQLLHRMRRTVAKAQSTDVLSLAVEALRPAMLDWFQAVHQRVLPIALPALRAHCAAHGRALGDYAYHAASGLIGNACLAPECPFYLVPRDNFQRHLQVWGPRLPSGFHKLVREHRQLPPRDVLALFLAGGGWGPAPRLADLRVTEGQVLQYITDVQAAYATVAQ